MSGRGVGVGRLFTGGPRQGAAPPVPPPALPTGPAAVFRADTGVFSDAAGTTPAFNGNSVACWKDQSGNGHDLTQLTAGSRPVLIASRGKYGVGSTVGAGWRIDFNDVPFAQLFPMYVAYTIKLTTHTGDQSLLDRNPAGGPPFAPGMYAVMSGNAGRPGVYANNAAIDAGSAVGVASDNNVEVVRLRLTASAFGIRRYGGAEVATAVSLATLTNWISLSTLAGNQYLLGTVTGLAIYQGRTLSSAEDDALCAWASALPG